MAEGCVELNDLDIETMVEYAELEKPVYIYSDDFRIPVKNGVIQKNVIKPDTVYSLKENKGIRASIF